MGQDSHSLTLRNESVGGNISSVWIQLKEMHVTPLKSHHLIHNRPHFLAIQTTVPSPANGPSLQLADERHRDGCGQSPS